MLKKKLAFLVTIIMMVMLLSVNSFVVYAAGKTTSYKVSYNANKGSGAPVSQTKKANTPLILSEKVPTRTGYQFLGWAKTASAEEAVYTAGGSYKKNASVTLYAVWKANRYTIKYNSNGGSGTISSHATSYGNNKTLKKNTFTKKGYTFIGWNTKKDGSGTVYADGQKVKNLTSKNKGKVTLYAQWKANRYTIKYNANGGSGTMSSHATSYGNNKTLKKNTFTQKGYTFVNWNTKKDGSGKTYTDGQKVKNLTSKNKGKVTLYAQWEANRYTIKYNSNGGKGSMSSHAATYGKSKTLKTNTFTREGYVFAGWNTKKDGTGKSYTNGQKVKNLTSVNKKKITMYAQWKKARVTATGMDYSKYSVDEIVKYFIEVVCDTEYSTGSGDYTAVQKWIGPIYYKINGSPTKKDLLVLQSLCDGLNANENFPGIYPMEKGYYNLSLNFWNYNEFYDNMGDFINYESADGAVQYWYDTYGNYMTSATIGCRTDINQYVRNSVIQEEIINGLGISDTWLREDSMVYAGYSEPQELSVMDWVIVELLYHPDIKCGMNASECEKVIRSILK